MYPIPTHLHLTHYNNIIIENLQSLAALPQNTTPPAQLADIIIYLLLFALGLLISSSFGGLETACYTLSRLRLFLRRHQGDTSALLLHNELRNMPRLITTLLIGNNLGNYLCTFALTAVLSTILHLTDTASIAIQALLLTPFLFLVAETIPKEFCRTRAESITYPAARFLVISRTIFTITGLLPLVTLLGNALVHLFRTDESQAVLSARLRMAGTLHEGVGSGLISPRQMNMVERFLEAETVPARKLMTPWKKVITITSTETPNDFLMRIKSHHHATYPLVNKKTGRVIGTITTLDLIHLSESDKQLPFEKLSIHQPATTIKPDTPLPGAIKIMRTAETNLAIITSPPSPEKPLGIITKKDLLEPLITPRNTTIQTQTHT